MEQIHITVPGIKKSLRSYDPKKAISEYICNGFDAGANCVEIEFNANNIGGIDTLRIIDNGHGINYHRLHRTFRPFFESEKDFDAAVKRKFSAVQGKNGVGRLTFFTFAQYATWYTVFKDTTANQEYRIDIAAETLNEYLSTEPENSTIPTGTIVEFTGIRDLTSFDFEEDIPIFLMKRFGWLLELNAARQFSIKINGDTLDYSGIIGDRDQFQHVEMSENQQVVFDIRYIRWNERLIDEYSHYYFIGSDDIERFKVTTTLNNKGDSFYHSVYIQSDYFDMVDALDLATSSREDDQLALPTITRNDKIYKNLREMVDRFLRDRRKPFLRKYTDTLIRQYENDGVFPQHSGDAWDHYRHQELENVVRELYQLAPKIFTGLNTEQKKTFVHFLNLLIAEGERESLLEVLREIVELDPSELEELANLLRESKLSSIIKTIRLIEDRYRAISQLNELVFNPELHANEPEHIQKMIESHYWIFGEQYHLVTAAEPKFEEALRRYIYLLRGEKTETHIEHQDKNKEMDIFMVRWSRLTDHINNVVVELKNPKVRLGEKELGQVKNYMSVTQSQPEFNAQNMSWEFYLVGNRFDTTGYIERELENTSQRGENSLVYAVRNYKIYVKTWSEIFTDFEIRHNFLLEKLKEERDWLSQDINTADAIVDNQRTNAARRPPQVAIPTEGD